MFFWHQTLARRDRASDSGSDPWQRPSNATDPRLALSWAEPVMPQGRHTVRPLFGIARQTTLTVGADGRISRWIAVPTLALLETHVLELTRPNH